MKTLIIDNYDSHTYNILQIVSAINKEEPIIYKNDEIDWETFCQLDVDNIIISSGPGRPERDEDFGFSKEIIQKAKVPVLGVCLGHQGIGSFFGGEIIHAPEVMHGRLTRIFHNNSDLFKGIPQGIEVVSYHSLIVDQDSLPNELEITSWTDDGIIMGLKHKVLPIWGVQFHPESISTEYGEEIFRNFYNLTLSSCTNQSKINNSRNSISTTEKQKQSYSFMLKYREIEYHNPEDVFPTFYRDSEHAFWLDSSKVDTNSRFSFMGDASGPYSRIMKYSTVDKKLEITNGVKSEILNMSIFDYLDNQLENIRYDEKNLPFQFQCGFIGYFGYELKNECNDIKNKRNIHVSSSPDAYFLFADRVIAFDQVEKKMYLLCLTNGESSIDSEAWFNEIEKRMSELTPSNKKGLITGTSPELIEFKLSKPYGEYLGDIEKIKGYLIDGETYEVNYTARIKTELNIDPLNLYMNLRSVNPAPYSAYLKLGETKVLSSSPEKFITIDTKGKVTAKPIKGTIRRGSSIEEDNLFKDTLESSKKDRAENLMTVDLLRNDLGKVCEIGSITVPNLMEIESFETVHQLVSTIEGTLKRDCSTVNCFRTAFPGGSMTGTPKIRTMEIIDEVEGEARGVYSGSIGYFGLNGSADFNIIIRTIVIEENKLTIGAGGAITIQSDPNSEYEEMLLKANALLKSTVMTLKGANRSGEYYLLGDKNIQSELA